MNLSAYRWASTFQALSCFYFKEQNEQKVPEFPICTILYLPIYKLEFNQFLRKIVNKSIQKIKQNYIINKVNLFTKLYLQRESYKLIDYPTYRLM